MALLGAIAASYYDLGVSAAEWSLVRWRGDRICDLCCLLLD